MPAETPTSASDGRVVWITGASSGIGRAVAHACARRGDRLVLSARAADVLAQVQRECEDLGATGVLLAPLYITDGDQIDWLYGSQRIFSFTWELYPPETSTVWGDHYPPDETIATQTARVASRTRLAP